MNINISDYVKDGENLDLSNFRRRSDDLSDFTIQIHYSKKYYIFEDLIKFLSDEKWKKIRTLDLSSYFLQPDKIKLLSEALKINSVLTSINIRNNLIGNEGMEYLSKALNYNKI